MSTNELELKPGLKPKPPAPATTEKGRLCNTGYRVSEPACFGAAPAPVPGEKKNNFGIF